jgi:hypothetical protein
MPLLWDKVDRSFGEIGAPEEQGQGHARRHGVRRAARPRSTRHPARFLAAPRPIAARGGLNADGFADPGREPPVGFAAEMRQTPLWAAALVIRRTGRCVCLLL